MSSDTFMDLDSFQPDEEGTLVCRLPRCSTCQQKARSDDKYLPTDYKGIRTLVWPKKGINKAGAGHDCLKVFFHVRRFRNFNSGLSDQETNQRDMEEGHECGPCRVS